MWEIFMVFLLCILQIDVSISVCANSNSTLLSDSEINFRASPSIERRITCGPYESLTKSELTCEVTLIYADYAAKSVSRRRGIEGCHKEGKNNFIINVSNLIKNVSFECTSNSPLDIKINFEHDATIIQYTSVTRERVVVDFDDTESYKYKLKVLIPAFPLVYGISKTTTLVKYQILQIGNPAHINALFYILDDNWDVEGTNTRVHWMKENATIFLDDEIINIPCLSLSEEMLLFHVTRNGSLEKVTDGVKYDLYNGLFINTTKFLPIAGEFVCSVVDLTNGISNSNDTKCTWQKFKGECHRFELLHIPNALLVEPVSYAGLINQEDLYDLQKKQEPFYLRCSHLIKNVTMHVNFKSKSGNIRLLITHRIRVSPVWRHEVSAVLLHLPVDECILDDYGLNCKSDSFEIECLNAKTNELLYKWTIKTKRTITDEENKKNQMSELHYDFDERNFKCEPFDSSSVEEVSISHIGCDNELQCRKLSKCLHYVGTSDNDVDVGHTDCISSQTTFASMPCRPTSENATQRQCALAKPLVSCKGILQCLVKRTGYKQFFMDVFIQGFDDELYGNYKNEVPLNAVLKLTKYHSDETYNTGGKFVFKCEAHSFIFEEGLVWLFKHSINGSTNTSIRQVPDKYILPYPDTTSKLLSTNSRSTVEITMFNESIIEVICAAPRMYHKKKWELMSLPVKVRDSISPNITSVDVDKTFIIGKSEYMLICKADGFPLPDINWKFQDKEIDNPNIQILDKVLYKALLFLQFDESLIGDYVCNASNILNSQTKTFHVTAGGDEEDDSSEVYSFVMGYIAMAILLIIAVAAPYYHFKKMRNKKKEDMKEVIDLLHGTVAQSQEQYDEFEDTIIRFPYNKKYELRRDSFIIENVLLGKGNYGEVYKGRIQGRGGPCAFKTLIPGSSINELRAIVYELKMLNYIGKHENVVQLVGAYTKEILEGKIYIVTELCSLGSLEDYLRSNRDIFIENINRQKNKNNEFSNDNISVCSYQRLLIWSKQIANALDYIWSKRVLHGDVATRNVLLTADGVAKVTDFGLSRRLDTDYKYIKQHNDALPWQWLAVESLKNNEYSVYSDVWAYGITLWEIFTLGEVPYPGILPPKDGSMVFWTMFIAQLESGLLQNSMPKYASPQIYKIMQSCWEVEPKNRPSFSTLRNSFQLILKDWKEDSDKVELWENCETTVRLRFMSEAIIPNMTYMKIATMPESDYEMTEEQEDALEHGYVFRNSLR